MSWMPTVVVLRQSSPSSLSSACLALTGEGGTYPSEDELTTPQDGGQVGALGGEVKRLHWWIPRNVWEGRKTCELWRGHHTKYLYCTLNVMSIHTLSHIPPPPSHAPPYVHVDRASSSKDRRKRSDGYSLQLVPQTERYCTMMVRGYHQTLPPTNPPLPHHQLHK